MKPFANFSADFRRFIARPLSSSERACIERLERQRARCGRVRAYINDPSGTLRQVLLDYFRWHQQRLSLRDAVVITPRRFNSPGLRARFATARGYTSLLGAPVAVGQILLFGADMYCPSVPAYANYLDRILPAITPLTCGRDSIIIICGDAANLSSRFAELYSRWLSSPDDYFQVLDIETLTPVILHLSPPTFNFSPLTFPLSPFPFNFSPLTFNLKKPPELPPESEPLLNVA